MMPLLLLSAAVAAPDRVGELHKVVVAAIRNCPKGAPGEIVVCSRDRGYSERYRLPRLDPRFARSATRGAGPVAAMAAGAGGTGSCGTTGAGGSTGCTARWIGSWADEQKARRGEERP